LEQELLAKAKNVTVEGYTGEEPTEGKEAELLKSYFINSFEIRIPLDDNGRVRMDSDPVYTSDEYKRAIFDCLRPMLPPQHIRSGGSWVLPTKDSGGESGRTRSEMSTGIRPSVGLYDGDIPLRMVEYGSDAPDSYRDTPVTKLSYSGVNLVDCHIQVSYLMKEKEKLLKSVIYRATGIGDLGAIKKYAVSLAK
jgi:hypothetical protein